MLDGVTLDQFRTFVTVVDEGSFSAAGRRLRRAQSVVSQTLANMEGQLGIKLFDRTKRIPVLTEAGRALLPEARAVTDAIDSFKARARGLAGGLEAELPVVVDVMLPTAILTQAIAEFSVSFPDVPLRLYVEALGAVLKMVLEGTCAFGIVGTLPNVPEDVVREHLMEVQIVPVAAPSHPLGLHPVPLTINDLSEHVQLVLTDRSSLSNGTEIGVVSAKPWRLADLGAKHAFLKAGMGWGGMPLHLVQTDIDSGALVILDIVEMPRRGAWIALSAVFKADAPPGPAGRWLIERFKAKAEKD
ncbi:LysR family transcriptional regulator [Rhizobium lusitanum]|uniref:LysR family transcriptional regulator n=1 Tax=Rhizobium lusitanum TaxID=293958 RepID=UPI00195B10FB|nr:LysR family transcriptional regulator [Rhizobium lusitanum]MBM7044777.1 LysR family transcriptional regulator [Rhizobium lusitanum]